MHSASVAFHRQEEKIEEIIIIIKSLTFIRNAAKYVGIYHVIKHITICYHYKGHQNLKVKQKLFPSPKLEDNS